MSDAQAARDAAEDWRNGDRSAQHRLRAALDRLADTEARVVAAEAELAKRDNRLEMVRENLRHIAVSLPRAVLRQKLEDLAALAAAPASPAHAEPPREERDAVCVEKWPECRDGEYDPRCCRFPKSCSCTLVPAPAEPPERPT